MLFTANEVVAHVERSFTRSLDIQNRCILTSKVGRKRRGVFVVLLTRSASQICSGSDSASLSWRRWDFRLENGSTRDHLPIEASHR